MITYGPVPSRRLGRSLGINNIPYKNCSYSCVYCQVGRTHNFEVERLTFYEPQAIFAEVKKACDRADAEGELIDYVTFVPDGEPTLDKNLRETIGLIHPLGKKIAVITNGSLLGDEEVRATLLETDWVSFKVDTVIEKIWRKIDRPHKSINFEKMLEGMLEFRKQYSGTLVSETMLVYGLNDGDENISATADFLGTLKPARSYLSIPIRPPAETWVSPPAKELIAKAYQNIADKVDEVEYLIGYEGNAFSSTGEPDRDLLNITAVHPMRKDAVERLLQKTGSGWDVVERLLKEGSLLETEYDTHIFYIRAWN